jgi:predicted nucleic acid-binding protein
VAVYLDASALVKLVVLEPESSALRRFLRRHPQRITSALSRVEVLRAVRAQGSTAQRRASQVLARVAELRLDDAVLDAASRLDPVVLRSLDAIHIASAQALEDDLTAVVTYDRRMLEALAALDLEARAPGASYDQRPLRPRRKMRRRP